MTKKPKTKMATIQNIITDKWGNEYILLKEGKNTKRYIFSGIEGKHKVKIFTPDGCRSERVEIIGQ